MKITRFYILCTLLVLANVPKQLFAQSVNTVLQADSLMPAVEVTALLNEEFRPATKVQKLDSAALEVNYGYNLAQLLRQQSHVAVREYGAGQLSTVSFRGTGSSHTAVLWNGLNINSPVLGMTDFSEVPVAALENVEVIYGNGSPMYGSDALGGTINLSTSKRSWQPGFSVGARSAVGSFGYYDAGGELAYGSRKVYFAVKPYIKLAENDFPFHSGQRKEAELRNENSAFKQYGTVFNAVARTSGQEVLSLDVWLHKAWRQIQPNIQKIGYPVNYSPDQEISFLRSSLQYRKLEGNSELDVQLAYLYDENTQYGTYQTSQLVTKGQYANQFRKSLKAAFGGELIRKEADNVDYSANEIWSGVYAHFLYTPAERANIAANLRQSAILGKAAVLLPSLEGSYAINDQLVVTAKASRHFRFSSLNDRYWPELGNPDLKPENGWQAETGLTYKRGNITADTRFFYMNIEDWILWIPQSDGNWKPKNVQQVISKGIELDIAYTLRKVQLKGQANYVRSVSAKLVPGLATEADQQLPYTPKVKGNFLVSYIPISGFTVFASAEYTGLRFTTNKENVNQSLPHFYLLHAGITYSRQVKAQRFLLTAGLQNILDHQYQSYGNWAMPGRSFNLSLAYSLH